MLVLALDDVETVEAGDTDALEVTTAGSADAGATITAPPSVAPLGLDSVAGCGGASLNTDDEVLGAMATTGLLCSALLGD
jgi:hypothetical protein